MNRFLSLDIFRGLTVAGMIFVNNGGMGGHTPWLAHVPWDGCTGADFVFPFFLFIVGAALRFASAKTHYELTPQISFKLLKRGALIFLIGVLLHYVPFTESLANIRIPGVLQRIAIVFVAAGFLTLWLKSFRLILASVLVILLGYWGFLYAVNGMDVTALKTNPIGLVDVFLFGENHILSMNGVPFDPEAILSTIPAIANALLGYLCAMMMQRSKAGEFSAWMILAAGVVMVGLALLWDMAMPFNKRLWSSSFVLYTSGWGVILWVLIYGIVDVRGWVKWSMPLRVFGVNALFAYVLSCILAKLNYLLPFMLGEKKYNVHFWLHEYLFIPLGNTTGGTHLYFSFTMVLICWLVSYPLYRKKIYIKI